MMNSEHEHSPEKVLDTIMGLLNDERITKEVDAPIDQAVDNFCVEITAPLSHESFNQVVAQFVQHLYLHGLRIPRELSAGKALTEAISILEMRYQGVHTAGYDGALLDAVSGNLEGLELVMSLLTESLKELERETYTKWVFVSNIDQSDWGGRHKLVSAYLKQYENILPPQLRDMDPARFADHVDDLIINHLSTEPKQTAFLEL
jgi:hypothetical protein